MGDSHSARGRCAWLSTLALTLFFGLAARPCSGQVTQDVLGPAIESIEIMGLQDIAFDKTYGILLGDQLEGVWRISPGGAIDHLNTPGQGPGEFTRLNCVAWGRDGGILIGSRFNGRIVGYSNGLVFKDQFGLQGVSDLVVGTNGHIYASTIVDARGPIMEFDSSGEFLRSLTTWRPSEDLVGVPQWKSASEAILCWDDENDLLIAGYIQDATFQVFSNGQLVRTFQPDDPAVAAHDRMRTQALRKNPGQRLNIQVLTLTNFFMVDHGEGLFALIGGVPMVISLNGHVIRRASRADPAYQAFFPGPDGTVIAQEKETWKLRLVRLDELLVGGAGKTMHEINLTR